ncbi:alanine:cation symporter family protein [Mollicutes bacterium LVI A0078]|nr:alanine:cation symporter family protein [Mollicutes bacterium LVI A0075]WOO91247.1 alanine:cation symporter family protein [Mollicutes bacterium LVI A0078]
MFNFFTVTITILFVLLVGLYLTYKMRFIQVREFNRGWIKMFRHNQSKNGLSSFSAASLAIGGRIGTGNIAGVALAIYLCGYGVMFWLWVAAFFGMALSFVETTLAQVYKEYDEDGEYLSGPMVYIERGIGGKYKYLGYAYGILLAFTVGFMYIVIHTKTIISSVLAFAGVTSDIQLESFLVLIIMLIAAYILYGGTKKVARVAAYVVPVMMISYIVLVLLIALAHLEFIPKFFMLIIGNAFTPGGVLGGGVLTMIVVASALSTLSNEAGLGTSTLAAGLANGSHPAQQGFVNMITIFIDVVICSLTAFVLILAIDSGSLFAELVVPSNMAMESFDSLYKGGNVLLVLFILVFTFTTLITSITYGLQVIKQLMLNHSYRSYKIVINLYLIAVFILIILTPFIQLQKSAITAIVEVASVSLLAINIFAIYKLRRVAYKVYEHYHTVGHDFKAEDIGVEYKAGENDIWI